ncbi:hypothetical protein HPB47_019455 [Ixodes persulcatus]|uniref:Uncharacterized protein n=1 Tax=Ixodes persulcatus TaxID=34615 RepID=A0AC60QI46_IXOPE|nr:hypothetical protein HPB47_019455 [Ixodes persulcatus]
MAISPSVTSERQESHVLDVRGNTFGSLVRNPTTTVEGFISPRLPTLNVHCRPEPSGVDYQQLPSVSTLESSSCNFDTSLPDIRNIIHDVIREEIRKLLPAIRLLGLPGRSGKIRDLSQFDAQFFGVEAKQAHVMDPQLRLLLETSYEAIVDAGYDPGTLRGRKIGVFMGCSDSETYEAFNEDTDKIDGHALVGCCRAMFSNRVSYSLDFSGPSFTADTGSSSAMIALNQAMLALRSGQCEAALVGGSTLTLKPARALNFLRLGSLSPDGKCKAFDADGKGFVRSEAVGMFFIQRVSEARRIYAKVVHVKANADGFKAEGITFPSGRAQEALLREVYEEARVDPHTVSYVEAHGTGTKAGDPQEVSAISNVFCGKGRKEPLLIGSVKSNMGHFRGRLRVATLAVGAGGPGKTYERTRVSLSPRGPSGPSSWLKLPWTVKLQSDPQQNGRLLHSPPPL